MMMMEFLEKWTGILRKRLVSKTTLQTVEWMTQTGEVASLKTFFVSEDEFFIVVGTSLTHRKDRVW